MRFGERLTDSHTVRVACPACEEIIDLAVPLLVSIDSPSDAQQRISVAVDNSVDWQQPIWDHQLIAHGPDHD